MKMLRGFFLFCFFLHISKPAQRQEEPEEDSSEEDFPSNFLATKKFRSGFFFFLAAVPNIFLFMPLSCAYETK